MLDRDVCRTLKDFQNFFLNIYLTKFCIDTKQNLLPEFVGINRIQPPKLSARTITFLHPPRYTILASTFSYLYLEQASTN